MSAQQDYWQECISIAAEECELKLTPEQGREGDRNPRHRLFAHVAFAPPPGADPRDQRHHAPYRRAMRNIGRLAHARLDIQGKPWNFHCGFDTYQKARNTSS